MGWFWLLAPTILTSIYNNNEHSSTWLVKKKSIEVSGHTLDFSQWSSGSWHHLHLGLSRRLSEHFWNFRGREFLSSKFKQLVKRGLLGYEQCLGEKQCNFGVALCRLGAFGCHESLPQSSNISQSLHSIAGFADQQVVDANIDDCYVWMMPFWDVAV